jgi:hypothetical protein
VTKVGRNQPCTCGSGKKYKKCCGSNVISNKPQNQSNQPERVSARLKGEAFGLPGLPIYYCIRPVFSQPSTPSDVGSDRKSLKTYDVIFTFSRPGEQLLPDNQSSDAAGLVGNSHFRFWRTEDHEVPDLNLVGLHFQTKDGIFHVREFLNTDGFLGKIEIVSIEAENARQAERKARRFIMPSISFWATAGDVPLYIFQVDVIEHETKVVCIRGINPMDSVVSKGLQAYDLKEEVHIYLALYREALNSNSFLYQFLCFYKIIEGIRARQRDSTRDAANRGEILRRPSERIPTEPHKQIEWLKSIYALNFSWSDLSLDSIFPEEFVGRKINDIVDKELRPLRDAVAHAFLDEEDMTLSIDDADHTDKVFRLLPITKCIARRLLKIEFPDQFPVSQN